MSSQQRLLSLDALRGLTIIGMIIVNDPADWGNVYPPLLHADWIGCTPTDLVFPFFLFISGFSLYISTQRRLARGDSKGSLFRHLAKRSALIYLIGLLLNGFPYYELATLRIMGVLQRIALVNFFAGTLLIYTSHRARNVTGALILAGYWILLCFIPSPLAGEPTIAYETNWVAWFDQLALGKHTWGLMPLMDPEGIISTFPALVTGLLGIEISRRFQTLYDKDSANRRTVLLLLSGVLLAAAGLAWSSIFPLVKKLWTSSYVLYTAGLASMTLGVFYWFADVLKKDKQVKMLAAFGINPLALYVGSELIIMILGLFPVFGSENQVLPTWLFNTLVSAGMAPNMASLVWALLYTALFAVMAWVLYKKKIIIKL